MTPNVDWFALSPVARAARGRRRACSSPSSCPRAAARRRSAPIAAACGFVGAFVAAALLY